MQSSLLPGLRTGSLALGAVLAVGLAGCSDSSKTATTTSPSGGATSATNATSGAAAPAAQVCSGVAGDKLVTLADDKHLQSSDNIVPLVRTAVAKPPLTTALNAVSAALSQDALNMLNSSVSVDRQQPKDAAAAFVKGNNLGKGVSGGSGSITVIAANFSENQVLANIYADVLDAAGYQATVQQSTNREAYEPALEKGAAQVVPEYAATLTRFFDKSATTSGDITTTLATLKPLAQMHGLTVLMPAAATDQNSFAVTSAFAGKYGVKTLSDLAQKCPGGVTLGGPTELAQRPYGQQGLENKYGMKITSFTSLDSDGPLTRSALKSGKIALGLVFSSDADVSAA